MNTPLFDRINQSFQRQDMMQHLGARLVRAQAVRLDAGHHDFYS